MYQSYTFSAHGCGCIPQVGVLYLPTSICVCLCVCSSGGSRPLTGCVLLSSLTIPTSVSLGFGESGPKMVIVIGSPTQ